MTEPEKEYIITEGQLKTILERRGALYISCQGKFRDDIVKEVRSRPYTSAEQVQKLLKAIELECKGIEECELRSDARTLAKNIRYYIQTSGILRAERERK